MEKGKAWGKMKCLKMVGVGGYVICHVLLPLRITPWHTKVTHGGEREGEGSRQEESVIVPPASIWQ